MDVVDDMAPICRQDIYNNHVHQQQLQQKSSGWLPWSSLGTLKHVFNVPSDDQGSHPEDLNAFQWWQL